MHGQAYLLNRGENDARRHGALKSPGACSGGPVPVRLGLGGLIINPEVEPPRLATPLKKNNDESEFGC
jgi:hypothetical protein